MNIEARYVALAVAVFGAIVLLVTKLSPDLFGTDRTKYDDVVFGLFTLALISMPAAMLRNKASRDFAKRYYGGPVVLVALCAGFLFVGTYLIVYGRSELKSLFGI